MIYLKAILLAIVEGTTEFLPISSTGHLILADALVRLSNDEAFNNAFIIVIQFPAILSVLLYFRHDLWPLEKGWKTRPDILGLWGKILVAFVPAALLGPFLSDTIDAHLLAPVPVAVALIVGGAILIATDRKASGGGALTDVADLTLRMAFLIGLFQCLAMIPGTSRSAATIIGAMLLGASRPVAARFSFFLAVPTMAGAAAYTVLRTGFSFTGEQWAVLALGSLVSFLVAYAVIAAFMNFIRHRSFVGFGYYRIVLAACVFVFVYLGWIDGH